MRPWIGDALMWAGAAVGALGGVLLAIGAWLDLPPALVVAIAKALPFVVALALLTVGAVMRRHARRDAQLRALDARSRTLPEADAVAGDTMRGRTPVTDPLRR